MEALRNTRLLTHGSDIPGSRINNTPLLLLYFGACWSVPCKDLTPYLVMAYNQINNNGKVLEIIYVSQDPTENQFREIFREMPWLAVSRRDLNIIEELRVKFSVSSVPQLVLTNPKGEVLKSNCTNDIIQSGLRWIRPYLTQ